MDHILARAREVAIEAVARAREAASERARSMMTVSAKGRQGDVVTDIDRTSECMMIAAIKSAFPEHGIVSEETGELGGSQEWVWHIDPLDGTNNVVLGLPIFGSCITLCHTNEPVVAAIYVGHEDAIYSAVKGQGAFRDGVPIGLKNGGPPERVTVSWIQGYGVRSDDPIRRRTLDALERRFKRTLGLWAPSVDWALLAKARIGAVVSYENEREDLLGGVLIAVEAGAVVTDFSGKAVTDVYNNSQLVIALPEVSADIAAALSEPS
jgi:myo-inositol-1(or 4)-monophosphatase